MNNAKKPLTTPWLDITQQIRQFDRNFNILAIDTIGGGCINQTYRIQGDHCDYFVKLNKASFLTSFEAEAAGLTEIQETHTIRVPEPKCYGYNTANAWLVLEYISLNPVNKNGYLTLGQNLAALHHITSQQFGWFRDNTIGATLQKNNHTANWVDFWRHQRLGYQLHLAKQKGYGGKLQQLGEKLLTDLDLFFPSQSIVPALLHGDLWSGNCASDQSGQPIIYDPAVYYGDRETDLAMTELFGGFPSQFYAAYQEAYPLDKGYNIRKTLYNLYHILNHLNLFGGGYLRQAEQMQVKLLAELRS
ncbi:MAG TPA: fructosamine kinase family protein [Nitrosomonas sp.]|nr:fructosamine kinase family protein [Nitrosomonas sp.]